MWKGTTKAMSDIRPADTPDSASKVSPFDAYQPPPLAPDIVSAQSSAPRFGRVKAICIVAIVLGGAGVATALMGAVGLVVGRQMQAAFSGVNQPGVSQELQDVQLKTQQEIQAVQERFLGINAVLLGAHAIVAGMLLTGGIQALRRVRPGRKLLVAACSAAIVFELVRGSVQTVIQLQVLSVTTHFFEQMMEASMEQAADLAEWLVWFSRLAMVAGLALAIGWILVKLVFYCVAVWYLRKPVVCEYLDNAGAP
jgi:hypothetical protein